MKHISFKNISYQKKIKNIEILDVGTGNGRLLFELATSGFVKLSGIDMSERLLDVAKNRAKETKQPITFYHMDASSLSFEYNSFDLIIALGQITCLIPDPKDRTSAINEYYRVLKPNGLLVMSVLDYDGRWLNPFLSVFFTPIKLLRAEFNYLNYKYFPPLFLGGKINYTYLYKSQSYTYWYKKKEILQKLSKFKVVEVISSRMIKEKINTFKSGDGLLYIIAQKH